MSKTMQSICRAALGLLLIAAAAFVASAQDTVATIRIEGTAVAVEGSFADASNRANPRALSFLRSIAGFTAPAQRLSALELADRDGKKVTFRRLADGEFLADAAFTAFRYKLDLQPPENPGAKAHLSWLEGDAGILMLADILPDVPQETRGRVRIVKPETLSLTSNVTVDSQGTFNLNDLGTAVFFVGRNWRERELTAGGEKIALIVSGEWQTDFDSAAAAVRQIYDHYERAFGPRPAGKTVIYLGKFPKGTSPGRWEAETRGANITIFSSEMNFVTQSVQKLHEQLRHEVFHLWFPNSLNLSGNYDWFYEGFALYASLRTAVAMNRIRFEDFLDTLGRAHAIDSASRRRLSLLAASENRWNGANTQIYARGIVTAFLCDAAMLDKSKGRESLEVILRELFLKHGPASPRTDANEAILSLLAQRNELSPIVEKYIKGSETIDWASRLAVFGIESANAETSAKLRVGAKLDRRQKDLLDKLGYNNWRKKSE